MNVGFRDECVLHPIRNLQKEWNDWVTASSTVRRSDNFGLVDEGVGSSNKVAYDGT
jgi:hypothetical protein